MKKLLIVILALSIFNTIYITVIDVKNQSAFESIHKSIDTLNQNYKVTVTMYNAVEGQCDADPLITAGMYKINPNKASEHKWVAMSRDMLKRWNGNFQYGDMIEIEGAGLKDGIYTVVDTMNKRYKNRIDILETKGTPLYKYENVIIKKVIQS